MNEPSAVKDLLTGAASPLPAQAGELAQVATLEVRRESSDKFAFSVPRFFFASADVMAASLVAYIGRKVATVNSGEFRIPQTRDGDRAEAGGVRSISTARFGGLVLLSSLSARQNLTHYFGRRDPVLQNARMVPASLLA
jgi:hypothetical protein